MTYFFILPIFLIYLLICIVLILISGFIRPVKYFFSYVWRAALLSVLGFILANALLWTISLVFGNTVNASNFPEQIRLFSNVPVALALFLGPIPASIFGVVFGVVIGMVWAYTSGRNKFRPNHLE